MDVERIVCNRDHGDEFIGRAQDVADEVIGAVVRRCLGVVLAEGRVTANFIQQSTWFTQQNYKWTLSMTGKQG